MRKDIRKPLLLVGCLVAVTCAAMAYSSRGNSAPAPTPLAPVPAPMSAKGGIVTLAGHLIQDKIHGGGDGTVGLALTLSADRVSGSTGSEAALVDMVIVLDRSGSMQGAKIRDARQATLDLLSSLSPGDRFALITYSDDVTRHCGLMDLTPANRASLETMIRNIQPGGSTNLGGGLQEGIRALQEGRRKGLPGRVILISDGLANRGITDPKALGAMASTAIEEAFAVSTVGVGSDFNEHLMTSLADRGAGNYHYLENPATFAEVFLKEFLHTREVAASSLEIRIPLPQGASMVHAAGYPVEVRDGCAVFHPGDLRSGQARQLFVTLRLDTRQERNWEIAGIVARYFHKGEPRSVTLAGSFHVACVKDPREALASIHKNEWERKVLQEDYNLLKEEVAKDIQRGDKKAAIDRIESYRSVQEAVNSTVNSPAVAGNLGNDLGQLRQQVDATFQGAPAEVTEKQKSNSKALQFKGYEGRRGK
jgi:Ca-activated chloride channel homolog